MAGKNLWSGMRQLSCRRFYRLEFYLNNDWFISMLLLSFIVLKIHSILRLLGSYLSINVYLDCKKLMIYILQHKYVVFNNHDELLKHFIEDVNILRNECLKFRSIYYMTSLVEPFYIINAHIQLMNDKYMVYVASWWVAIGC